MLPQIKGYLSIVKYDEDSKNCTIVKCSTQIKAITDYAFEVAAPYMIHIFKNADGTGNVYIAYLNGATTNFTVTSYADLLEFCRSRMIFNPYFSDVDFQFQ